MKKLSCHCGGVEAEVTVPDKGFEKVLRCNCSMCKKKGYIIGVVGPDDFKLTKGKELLKLYQFYTKTAKHYFCKLCGIKSFYQPRSHPDSYSIHLKCVDDPPEINEIIYFDGKNFEDSIKKI